MKKIYFVRHSQLTPPFNDYSKLNFNQICDLATHRVTPSIHPDSFKMIAAKFDPKYLKSIDLILCSTSNRTLQTAELISKLSNKPIQIIETDDLSEIFFDPAILTNQKEFDKNGMTAIRQSLFHGMKSEGEADSLGKTLLRAQKLKEELLKLPYQNILCISHSFYMRVLRLFFLENLTLDQNITESKLMETTDHPYLEGFEIKL